MSEAIWGLGGTLVGGLITIVGNWIVHKCDLSDRAEHERRQALVRAREERKVAYVRLLTAARRLRYLSRPGTRRDPHEIDSLRAELSSAQYEIALIGSPDMVSSAINVRFRTLAYLDGALEVAESAETTGPLERLHSITTLRLAARKAVSDFVASARDDVRLSV